MTLPQMPSGNAYERIKRSRDESARRNAATASSANLTQNSPLRSQVAVVSDQVGVVSDAALAQSQVIIDLTNTVASLMARIQTGTVDITPSASNTPTSLGVVFTPAFAVVPRVLVSPITTVPGTVVTGVAAQFITAAGFTAYVTRTNTTPTTIHWIAITP